MTTLTTPVAAQTAPRPTRPRNWMRALGWTMVVAVLVISVTGIDIRWSRLTTFPADLVHYLGLMFIPPDVDAVGKAIRATGESVEMAWLGTVIGVVISFPLGFLAANSIVPLWVRAPLRVIFALLRAVPEVVIAIIILSVTGLTPFTGALAIAVGSVGTLSKWGYEAIEGADPGPIEAARACGAGRIGVIRWAIWPSVSPEMLAFWLYRFEINVRASAILGLIGAGGIGSMLTQNVQYRLWSTVGTLFIVVVVVTVIIDQVSGRLRQRIITGRWSARG
ncbi:phosphonate ABC transporter, permease protein PhnE [Williamsia sp. CHRR-6]|uniref:phosphonate ABC transporter, permease protein PhnE n=1 Tax=Williamsia sp. CHRR-6 TaxID=2835871 RepID=UPI001BDA7DEB|nr:phosphonate ABC transporter, permease protein PhnE [Williamsia sp. CHRR-6]MBT0566453.1 phosphonate ABC transporter, permease protein PhnE [Williamsia sp. CHRR-6]